MTLPVVLAAALGGLFLASHFVLPVWTLLPAALTLLWRPSRALFILISAAIWAGTVRHTPPITLKTTCRATVVIADFPRPRYPFGFQENLRVVAPENCPLQTGDRLFGTLFAAQPLPLATTWQTTLELAPMKVSPWQQREQFRAYATISHPQPATNAAPWLLRQRAQLAARLAALFPAQQAFLQALIIGNRAALDGYQRQALQRTGTTHLVAISGLHLALLALTFFLIAQGLFVLLPARWRYGEPRTLALHASLLITLMYALLTGGAPPVLRAWLMFALVVAAWHCALLRGALTLLALAALLLFLWQPWQLSSASAWLSFSAVAVILASRRWWQDKSPFGQLIRLQLLLTVALLPLSWALFGGISVIGFVANLLLIPWLAPVLLSVFAALLISPLVPLAAMLVRHYFDALNVLATPTWAYFSPPWQPPVAAAGLWIVALVVGWQKGWRWASGIFLAAGLWCVVVLFTPARAQIFITRPLLGIFRAHGQTLVVNTGARQLRRNKDDAARWLLPALRRTASRPSAILLTQTGVSATTALQTLLKAYPTTPIFSLQRADNIPFPIIYCPLTAPAGLHFTRTATGCTAQFGAWQFRAKNSVQRVE